MQRLLISFDMDTPALYQKLYLELCIFQFCGAVACDMEIKSYKEEK